MHQDTPFNSHSNHANPGQASPESSVDDLVRVFNTALVATKTETLRDFSSELYALIGTPAFRAILGAVRNYGRAEGLSDREAAESIIQTFRKMDRLWGDYVYQEGMDRLKGPNSG